MATAVRRHTIVNPAGRNKARANKRRHMSAKQIKYFGTSRQKAALRAKRHNAAAKANRKHHHRNVAKPRATNPKPQARGEVLSLHLPHARNRGRKANPKRSNPGEILSLTLGNPAGKGRSMATAVTKQKNRHHKKHHHNAAASKGRKNPRQNPAPKAKANRHHHHKGHHHNPGMAQLTEVFTEGLAALGGLVGSRLLTQAVLGTGNVGAYGYAGNAAATAVLAGLAHMAFKNRPAVRNGIVIGGAAGILARAMQDYTPFGGYLQSAGFGDYAGGGAGGLGLYLASNAVVPQRYLNAAQSAQVEIPAGWAPTTVIQQAAPAGVSGYGHSRYSRY